MVKFLGPASPRVYLQASSSILLTICFMLFLVPLSLDDGISINYSFLLFPLLVVPWRHRWVKPHAFILASTLLYFLIFVAASVYQTEFYDLWPRRFSSFVLFLGVFSYCFIRIDREMETAFKRAVVWFGVCFSLIAMFRYIDLTAADLGFAAKDVVGTQRIGFVYLMGVWITLLSRDIISQRSLLNWTVMLILFAGLILTFSRASIIGLVGSGMLYVLFQAIRWTLLPTKRVLLRVSSTVLLIIVGLVLMRLIAPVPFDFYNERIVEYATVGNTARDDLRDPESSGGARLYFASTIIRFVYDNPLTGSGFLGIWCLKDDVYGTIGSAHIQYADILFRTGPVGFALYLYVLYRVMAFLFKNDQGMFWGFVAILLYGLFHETFKESQGGFILAVLVALSFKVHREVAYQSGRPSVATAG